MASVEQAQESDAAAAFETERGHLLSEIVQGLQEAASQMKTLNRNLEHVVEVGASFERSATVWGAFCSTGSSLGNVNDTKQ